MSIAVALAECTAAFSGSVRADDFLVQIFSYNSSGDPPVVIAFPD